VAAAGGRYPSRSSTGRRRSLASSRPRGSSSGRSPSRSPLAEAAAPPSCVPALPQVPGFRRTLRTGPARSDSSTAGGCDCQMEPFPFAATSARGGGDFPLPQGRGRLPHGRHRLPAGVCQLPRAAGLRPFVGGCARMGSLRADGPGGCRWGRPSAPGGRRRRPSRADRPRRVPVRGGRRHRKVPVCAISGHRHFPVQGGRSSPGRSASSP
jgi:hypothetical protein